MPKVFDIEGIGPMEFPDDVTDEEVLAFSRKLLNPSTGREEFGNLSPLAPISRGQLLREELAESRSVNPLVELFAGRRLVPTPTPQEAATLMSPIGFSVRPFPQPKGPLAEAVFEGGRSAVETTLGMTEPEMLPLAPLATLPGAPAIRQAAPLLQQTVPRAMGLLFGGQMVGGGLGEAYHGIEQGEPRTIGRGLGTALPGIVFSYPEVSHAIPISPERRLAQMLGESAIVGRTADPQPQRQLGMRLANVLEDPSVRPLVERALQETTPVGRLRLPGQTRALTELQELAYPEEHVAPPEVPKIVPGEPVRLKQPGEFTALKEPLSFSPSVKPGELPTAKQVAQPRQDYLTKEPPPPYPKDPNAPRVRDDKGRFLKEGVQPQGGKATRSEDLQREQTGKEESGASGVQGQKGLGVKEAQERAAKQRGETGAIQPEGSEYRPRTVRTKVGKRVIHPEKVEAFEEYESRAHTLYRSLGFAGINEFDLNAYRRLTDKNVPEDRKTYVYKIDKEGTGPIGPNYSGRWVEAKDSGLSKEQLDQLKAISEEGKTWSKPENFPYEITPIEPSLTIERDLPGITIKPKGPPSEAGSFMLPGPELIRTLSGFKRTATVAGQQLYNRVRNLLTPDEMKAYEDAGFRTFMSRPRSPDDVAKWMEENGPRVEVKTFTEDKNRPVEGTAAYRAQELQGTITRLQHEIETAGYYRGQTHPSFLVDKPEIKEKLDKLFEAENDLNEIEFREEIEPSEFDPSQFRDVASKDAPQKMVVVRVPTSPNPKIGEKPGVGRDPEWGLPLYKGYHLGSEDVNVLGWARWHDEVVGGKNVTVLDEVQKDWGQPYATVVEGKWRFRGQENSKYKDTAFNSAAEARKAGESVHPLLKDSQRLTLKAQIEQSLKEGKEAIVVPDDKTVMLSEGHDVAAMQTQTARVTGEVNISQEGGMRQNYDPLYSILDRHGNVIAKETFADAESAHAFAQNRTAGLGLREGQYDVSRGILHDIMEELTGVKGEPVDMGRHQNAVEMGESREVLMEMPDGTRMQYTGIPAVAEGLSKGGKIITDTGIIPEKLRSNLILRNPDGTIKTTATGRLYDLSKVKQRTEPFKLFGSDKLSEAKIGGIKITPGVKGSEAGAISLDPLKDIARSVSRIGETGAAVVRAYAEPILERVGRLGGAAGKMVTKEAQRIVSQSKFHYGELTRTLDPAKKAVGKAYRGGTTWIRGRVEVTPRAAISRTFFATEGGITIPQRAQDMVDKLRKANEDINYLGKRSNLSEMQRIPTVYGVDVIRRGRGVAWDAWTKGLATANGVPLSDVQAFFRHWKAEMDRPMVNATRMDKISHDFVNLFPRPITHIRPGSAWHEVLVADPFSYLENAAQRTAHTVAFREVYPQGSGLLEARRQAVNAEIGTERGRGEFDMLIRALQGHPMDSFTASWNAPDTAIGGSARMVSQVVGGPVRSLVLSANALANLGETIVGGPTIFFGLRNVIPAALKAGTLYKQLEMTGARNKSMQNNAFDPSSPIRSLSRQFSTGIRRVFFEQYVNEVQEYLAAASAKVLADRARAGDLSTHEMEMMVATMRGMGFSQSDAHAASRGTGPALDQFERKAAAFLTAGNMQMAERSRLGSSRLFNELFWFHTYPQMTANQLRTTLGNWSESIGNKDWPQVRATSELLGRQLGGKVMQGALTIGILSLAYEGAYGLKIRKQEASDEPGEFVLDSYLAAMGGPMYLMKKTIENSGDASTLQKTVGSMIAPVSVAGELMDMSLATGRYEGRSQFERIGMFVESKTPGYRAVKLGMSLFGLSKYDSKLDSSIKAFYRWRRENLGFRQGTSIGSPEEDKAFRAQMLRAIDALRNGKDWREALAEAGDYEKVSQSLYGRTILRTPQGPHLSDEQMEALRKHIGNEPVDMLIGYDAMVRQVARELAEQKSTILLDEPTGKLAVDIETSGQRQQHIVKKLSTDVQDFINEQGLKIPGYQPELKRKDELLEKPEADLLEDEIAKQYEKRIRLIMASPGFSKLLLKDKQEFLNKRLDIAKKQAEATVLRKRRETK